jgi:ferredoxin
MKVIAINKEDWAKGLERLKASTRLYAPVQEAKAHEFRLLEPGRLPDLENYLNTRMSAKGIIYPQTQPLFNYTLDESQADHHILKEVAVSGVPQAVIGIRPCDADAFALVRRNFDTPEYKDPYWLRALEATTLVGLACATPCGSCFCTTAGSGPFHSQNLDLLLVDTGERFLAREVTAKGGALLAAAGWTSGAAGAEQEIETLQQAAEKRIQSRVSTDELRRKVATELYEAPFWDDVAFACINCGTCTYLCPTCWCFDIQDENQGTCGVRLRNWDSCMYPLFTLHGSGHNPRSTKVQRVRQRFMHKLKYYVDKYDNGIQCVGCGRCVRACPVNIDIRRVCDLMNAYSTEACACNIAP